MFKICYLDDFDYSKTTQNIYSTFYVEVNDLAFPDNQWADFPFAVLRMWCENIIVNVINAKSSEFELFFMDGPFVIECKKDQDQVQMKFVNNRKSKIIETEYIIGTEELTKSLYSITQRLIWLVEQKDFGKIRDVEELKKLLDKIKT